MQFICDNCKKETDVLWFHEARIPNIIIKKNRYPKTTSEIKKAMSENGISVIPMRICSDCREFYGAS